MSNLAMNILICLNQVFLRYQKYGVESTVKYHVDIARDVEENMCTLSWVCGCMSVWSPSYPPGDGAMNHPGEYGGVCRSWQNYEWFANSLNGHSTRPLLSFIPIPSWLSATPSSIVLIRQLSWISSSHVSDPEQYSWEQWHVLKVLRDVDFDSFVCHSSLTCAWISGERNRWEMFYFLFILSDIFHPLLTARTLAT